ncbi:hypothetical protein P7C73_g954, partial [Tremellales sp. Uapishka_1]
MPRVLSDKNPHLCDHFGCGKEFTTANHLRRHNATHEKKRPYSCSICGKSFGRSEVRKRHEILHTNPQSSKPRIQPVIANVTRQSAPSTSNTSVSRAIVLSSRSQEIPIDLDTDEPSSRTSLHPNSTPDALPANSPGRSAPMESSPIGPTTTAHAIGMDDWSAETLTANWASESELFQWLNQIVDTQQVCANLERPAASVPDYLPASATGGANDPSIIHCQPTVMDLAVRRLLAYLMQPADPMFVLSAHDIQRCLELFWTCVHPQYPLLHYPTFDLGTAHPSLLTSMVILGLAQDGTADSASLAGRILSRCYGLVIAEAPIQSGSGLETLQTLVLLGLAGCSMGKDLQIKAQAFNAFELTLCRRYNYFEGRHYANRSPDESVSGQWKYWIQEESKRRVAWTILLRDVGGSYLPPSPITHDDQVQYATLLHQLPCRATSPFRLDIDLPSSDASWAAPTAESWSRLHMPGETLARALSSSMDGNRVGPTRYACGHNFAKLVLVHGLAALGWDVNHRDLIAPEVVKQSIDGFNMCKNTNPLRVLSSIPRPGSPSPDSVFLVND